MKRLGLAVLAFVLTAGMASAYELRRHPLTGETAPSPSVPIINGGTVDIYNYDWVTYFIEIHHRSGRLTIKKDGDIRKSGSIQLNPGAKVSIPSQQRIWTLEGNNGRQISVGVRPNRTVDIELVPDGDDNMIGLEAIVKTRRHHESQLLMAWERRPRNQWPRPPEPTPYQPPIPVIQDPYPSYPVPVVQDPYPVPVIGQDPPPYYGQPTYNPPVVQHPYQPPIQVPPPHPSYRPPIQIPHYNPNIYRR